MPDLAELARLDATAQAELCVRGDVSADELWSACLARIDALNPLLRAVVTVARDRPRGRRSGPFAGVPLLVKDSTPWPGLRWSLGSRLFATNVATMQTPFGRRLEEAGLVCAGKSATSELGLLASTETLLEGATLNPWRLDRSAGGSSGGSAAAVAAGLVPIAHANDGGGSIRTPASMCGVFGFMPTRGRTPPASFVSSDFGDMSGEHCITRSVRDSARFLAVTEEAGGEAKVGFVRDPIARSDRPMRIATFTRTMMGGEPEPAVRRAHDDAVALLVALGHHVEPIAAPSYASSALADAFFVIAGTAVADVVDRLDERRDVPVQDAELEPFTWALASASRAGGPEALRNARAVLADAARAYRAATRAYDAVLTPTIAREPFPLGHLSPVLGRDALLERIAQISGYAPIANAAGCPAMSVPLHVSDDGLPIGSHFAAEPGADARLLRLAYQLEEARPWRDRWPPYAIPTLF